MVNTAILMQEFSRMLSQISLNRMSQFTKEGMRTEIYFEASNLPLRTKHENYILFDVFIELLIVILSINFKLLYLLERASNLFKYQKMGQKLA